VNTYTIDNVRIRYSASNVAKGYAQGLDFRLNGEFVPGTNLGLVLAILKQRKIAKIRLYSQADQRLKFGLLFQDYMPNIPSVKIYLNLVYNTGLPEVLLPADPYLYQNRLNDYRRVDVGFLKCY
jgi:hypothetical protein